MNQEEIKSKRLEILEDTVKYYSEDVTRRAVTDKGNCRYKTIDGKRCAIGRLSKKDLKEGYSVTNSNNIVFNELEEELQLLGGLFLESLQNLHDSRMNWDKNGITNEGLEYVEMIKKSYCV